MVAASGRVECEICAVDADVGTGGSGAAAAEQEEEKRMRRRFLSTCTRIWRVWMERVWLRGVHGDTMAANGGR